MGNYIKILTFILRYYVGDTLYYIWCKFSKWYACENLKYMNITSLKAWIVWQNRFLRNGFMTFMLTEVLLFIVHCGFFWVKNESFSFGNDSEYFCKSDCTF